MIQINYCNHGDIVLGRKNKDLVVMYKDFVITKKRKVKFKNKELVQKLVKEMEFTIKN